MYEVPTEATPQDAATPGWIEVSGQGSVSVSPDRASVSVALETRATTAAEAASSNADTMDRVLRSIRGADFPGLEVETFGYAVNPEYGATDNRRTREIVAYTAHNNVRVTVSDVSAVGRLIDAAIGSGANRISSISFFAADTEEARREALANAVANARAQAEVIATSLGYRLGPPLEVNGGGSRMPMPRAEGMMMSARAADTPIEAGDQTVMAQVTVRFALGSELGG